MRSVDENRHINHVDQAQGLHRFQASQKLSEKGFEQGSSGRFGRRTENETDQQAPLFCDPRGYAVAPRRLSGLVLSGHFGE